MGEKFSKLKEQISKIENLKNVAEWGSEYQLWTNKTEKLVEEIFGEEASQLFKQQQTMTTSYIDGSLTFKTCKGLVPSNALSEIQNTEELS